VAIVGAPSPGRVRQAVGESLSGGDGHGESERVQVSVPVALVSGRGGLSIGDGRDHSPIPGGSDDLGEEAQAGRAAGEPGACTDQFDCGVAAQCLFQRRHIGVLEAGDVLLKQRSGPQLRGLAELVWCRGRLVEAGACPLQRALHRRRCGVEHGRDLGGRESEHLPQDEHGSLPREEVLQARDEGEPEGLAGRNDGRWIL
jgi:hypothetical protein